MATAGKLDGGKGGSVGMLSCAARIGGLARSLLGVGCLWRMRDFVPDLGMTGVCGFGV